LKAAILSHDGFKIRELDVPVVGDDEVLIKTIACGVCSGDLFVYKNRQALSATQSRLGHEGSGTVATMGRNATGFRIGDVVTSLGMPAYADYFITKPELLVMLPPEIEPVNALGEPIACCVHAGNCFGIRPGDRVALVGCGFMGLICLQLAKIQGAGFSCCIDPIGFRREISLEIGADVSLCPSGYSADDILKLYGEFDIVIEAAGTQSAIDLCTDLVAKHGRIILVGYHQSKGGMRTINMERWNYKAIDVVNGHVRRQDEKIEAMRQGMELMRQGHLVTEPLVSSYSFMDIEQAFRDLIDGNDGLMKAVLIMNDN
jgi:threonine dehydrogenase-like Zn-dependent dehydrogenase